MKTTIIDIGNSQGIIIPAKLLRKLNLSKRDSIKIREDSGRIIIESAPRQGWENAAKKLSETKKDPLIPDFFKEEPLFKEWTWEE